MTTDRYNVPGLQRGLQMLAEFRRDSRELTGAELARRLGLPRASVFRILQTLEQMGFVERVGDSASYRLGIAVLRLGFEFLASMELTEFGRPVLDELSAASGQSAQLVVRDATDVVVVAKIAGTSSLVSAMQVGGRLPAHATALGRVLLGGMPMGMLSRLYVGKTLQTFTAQTPTSLAELHRRVAQDAQRGYAISQSGFEAGVSTIAAPVFDERSAVAAAVSVTIPAGQIAPQQQALLVALVVQAANKLSRRIGGAAPVAPQPAAPLEAEPA
jgi:DNA-binding IclR family transcriptional regulator